MELCNHGNKHINLTDGTPADVDNEFGKAMAKWTEFLGPDAGDKIRYLATPFGVVPKQDDTRQRLHKYEYNGIAYPQQAILYAGYGHNKVAPSPFSKEFDPFDLPSIEVCKARGMPTFDEHFAKFQQK